MDFLWFSRVSSSKFKQSLTSSFFTLGALVTKKSFFSFGQEKKGDFWAADFLFTRPNISQFQEHQNPWTATISQNHRIWKLWKGGNSSRELASGQKHLWPFFISGLLLKHVS